ncbi:MAG TPA: hypothetical protein VHJ17_16045 [Thermomonospora sp.]|nr:hypothetical protein [Thermomonospora sp.]
MSEMDRVEPRVEETGEPPAEAPEADAAEQRAALTDEPDRVAWRTEAPFDANEADAAEQDQVVEFDEDDYR